MDDYTPHSPHTEPPSARATAALRDLQDRAQMAMTSRRERLSRLEAEITDRLETIAQSLAERPTAADTDARAALVELEQRREQLDDFGRRLDERAEQLDELDGQLAARRAELEEQLSELTGREQELTRRQQSLEEREQAAEMAHAQRAAEAVDESTKSAAEIEALQQKLELAHEDVQRYRARVAELEHQLAEQTADSEGNAAEWAALSAERDALAERVEVLESAPPADTADSEQFAELQQRFEMAVEDLREQKTKNAELESQLAATRKQHGGAADPGAMDWESQKRRLLASLEVDGGSADEDSPERQAERASIANTIEITDAIVAEKDCEIAALRAQLVEAASRTTTPDQQPSNAINELLDADEVIKQHRERIAQLERETEAKLREAELELSVERAKIGRQRAELDQLQSDLKAQRASLAANGAAVETGAPRRRWLSKLGLGGEDGQ